MSDFPDTSSEIIRFEFKNERPVDLELLGHSFAAFGREYRRINSEQGGGMDDDEPLRLHLKQIVNGSVIGEFIALAPYALSVMEHAPSVIQFCQHLGSVLDWLGGRSERPEGVTPEGLANVEQIIKPVAADSASQLNIHGCAVHGGIQVNNYTINLSSSRARDIQASALREIGLSERRKSGSYSNVVLKWYQARNDARSRSGDRAIVESIHRGAVKVVFLNPSVKAKILGEAQNPFKKAYIVDLHVETLDQKPVLYQITDVHDTIVLRRSRKKRRGLDELSPGI